MSRSAVRPAPIIDSDPVSWFARLERAVREQDYALASVARDRLYDLGWRIQPSRPRGPQAEAARPEEVAHANS